MFLLGVLACVAAVATLDTAGSMSAAVASSRCDLVQSIVALQPSTEPSTASAFCSAFISASQKTITAAAVTSTVRGRCFATLPAASATLSKRELENRAARSAGPLCPKYMTALGTSALSRACSCLAAAATVTTTPTVRLTTFEPVRTTTTSTVTVTPTASTVFTTSVSSSLPTSTATTISVATSQAVSESTAYNTVIASRIANFVVIRVVTRTVVSTVTALSTQIALSTTTITSTAATPLVKRLAPPSSPASSLPVVAPTGCYTLTSTTTTTTTLARPTVTIVIPSIALSTFARTDTSTSTVTTTRTTTITLLTTLTVSSATTSTAELTTFGTSTTTTTLVSTATSVVQVVATAVPRTVKPLRNPSFEEGVNTFPVEWSSAGVPFVVAPIDASVAEDGSRYVLMQFTSNLGNRVAYVQQDIYDPTLAAGFTCSFYYALKYLVSYQYCDLNVTWADNQIFSRRFKQTDLSTTFDWNYSGKLFVPPSPTVSGMLKFAYGCKNGANGNSQFIIDNIAFEQQSL
ncbi:hypothetical protein PYCC9005_002518 [Savitreella phatthalungensis]